MRRDWRMCGLRATQWLACFYPPWSPRVNGERQNAARLAYVWAAGDPMARLFLPPSVSPCQRGEAKRGATGVCVGCGRPNGSLVSTPLGPPCQRGEAKCGATGVCVGCGRPNGSLVSTPLGPPVSTGGGKMRRDWRMCGLRATQRLACFYPPRSPVSTGGGKMRRDWRMCWLRATQWLACFYPPRSPRVNGGRQNAARLAYVWAAGDSQSRPYGSGLCRDSRKRPASPHDDGGTEGGWRATHRVAPTDRDSAGSLARGQPPPMTMGGPRGLAGDSQSRPYGSGFCREFRKRPASPHDDGGTEGVGGRLTESPLRIGIMP